jgi:hypothetical protein
MIPYVENGDPAPLWRLLRSAVGSYAYCAPEILTKKLQLGTAELDISSTSS